MSDEKLDKSDAYIIVGIVVFISVLIVLVETGIGVDLVYNLLLRK